MPPLNVPSNSKSCWLYPEGSPECIYSSSGPTLVQQHRLLPGYCSGLISSLPASPSPLQPILRNVARMISPKQMAGHVAPLPSPLRIPFLELKQGPAWSGTCYLSHHLHPCLRAFALAVSPAQIPSSYVSIWLPHLPPFEFLLRCHLPGEAFLAHPI